MEEVTSLWQRTIRPQNTHPVEGDSLLEFSMQYATEYISVEINSSSCIYQLAC